MGAGVERAGDSCESRPEPKGSKMKPRHAAAVALGAELSGCGSRLLLGWDYLDWFAVCLTVLVIAMFVIGFVALAKMTRK